MTLSFSRVIIYTKKQGFLLLKQYEKTRNETFWVYPGGKCEINEHPYNCAIRETEEETGILLSALTLFHIEKFELNNCKYIGYYYFLNEKESLSVLTNINNNEPEKILDMQFFNNESLQKLPGWKNCLHDIATNFLSL
jgi:8-oxo-dGTP pyrophosphatase MutT (NUDIX family)